MLPVPAAGANPIGGYLRPSSSGDPRLLELALRQGRWDVTVLDGCASPPAPWSNVWLFTPQDGLPSLANADFFAEYDPVLLCPLTGASWHSDTPCAQDQDTCDVEMDGGYWEARGQDPPDPTETPVPPTPIVITRVLQAAAAPPPPPQVVYRDAPAPEPQVVTVVATVLVYVPTATPRPTLTPTLAPTLTPVPTWSAPTALALAPLATPTIPSDAQTTASGNLGIWGAILGGLAVIGMMVWRRRGAGEEA